jgi:hypothetical protein
VVRANHLPPLNPASGRIDLVTRSSSLDDLVETLLWWSVDHASSTVVVHDAAQAAAEDDVPEWVIALACLPADASAHDIEDVLDRGCPELAFPVVPRGNPEAVLAAALAMIRRFAAGRLAERDLARWTHDVIGHGRSKELERLVSLDDVYDTVKYSGDTIESVDAEVRAEADRLLHLHAHD